MELAGLCVYSVIYILFFFIYINLMRAWAERKVRQQSFLKSMEVGINAVGWNAQYATRFNIFYVKYTTSKSHLQDIHLLQNIPC